MDVRIDRPVLVDVQVTGAGGPPWGWYQLSRPGALSNEATNRCPVRRADPHQVGATGAGEQIGARRSRQVAAGTAMYSSVQLGALLHTESVDEHVVVAGDVRMGSMWRARATP